ncbi:MAG: hypothetical protein L0312_32125 [Acidobacteria bacterium]|nr:hypothetical protein [Acidobacteriota bacterium]
MLRTLRIGTALLPVLLLAAASLAQRDDALEIQLKAAMHRELVDGDLKTAIEQYKRIAAQGGSRKLAAQALVQMGRCYEKLGQDEARKAYERVLRDFADQAEQAKEARQRLAALTCAVSSTRERVLTTRRVWAGARADASGSPSPDGRLLCFVDWETGDLAVRDLKTGDIRRLTRKGSWQDSDVYAYAPRFSPDGNELAYAWWEGDDDLTWGIRLVSLDRTEPRILYRDKNRELDWIDSLQWSRDGKQIIAVVARADGVSQVVQLSVANGSLRALKTLDWRYPNNPSPSPDGGYIAYDFPPDEGSANRDIYLLASDGSRETTLVKHPAHDYLLGWLPAGNTLLFASDRSGTTDAWSVRIIDGKPQGAPELVKKEIGKVLPMGFTPAGSFYYGVPTSMRDIYVATLDPETGKVLAPPARATESFVGTHSRPAWSPDGKSLAYISQREYLPWDPAARHLRIRSFETGEEREIPTKIRGIWSPHWSPDGRALVVYGVNKQGHVSRYILDLKTLESRTVIEGSNEHQPGNPVWSLDGKGLFYFARDWTKEKTSLVKLTLDSGHRDILYSVDYLPHAIHPALSPDGQKLAFAIRDDKKKAGFVSVIPTTGGEPKALVKLRWDLPYDCIGWSRDGRYILYGTVEGNRIEVQTATLWRVPVAGGDPQRLDISMDGLDDLRIHPDGMRIAFTAGQYKTEVWVMENLLPALRAGR